MTFQNESSNSYIYDENLFNKLRLLRLKIAREKRMPAYIVFPDSTLMEIVAALPETEEEFSLIKGVGNYRLKKYAKLFVDEIVQYKRQQNGVVFEEIHRPRPETGDALKLVTRQEPGIAELDNFEELKAVLTEKLADYRNIAYTEDGLKDAKFDKANLNKLRKAVDSRKKYIKNICMEPYKEIEPMFKELLAMIDEPISAINSYISDMEDVRKDAKCSEIKIFFDKHSSPLGRLSEAVFCSSGFYESRWGNVSVSARVWQADVLRKIQSISNEIELIYKQYGEQAPALINKYLERCSLEDVSELYDAMRPAMDEFEPKKHADELKICLHPELQEEKPYSAVAQDQVPGNISVLIKISGSVESIMNYIARAAKEGLEINVIEKL